MGILKADGTPYSPDPVIDPVIEAGKASWSDLSYLHECYHNFMAAIQVGAPKDYRYDGPEAYLLAGKPKWNESDVFDSWCVDQAAMIMWRLQSLEEKKLQNRPSDSTLIHLIDDVKDPDPFLGKNMTSEDYDIYEFMLRKGLEALVRYQRGTYTLSQVTNHRDR